MLNLTMRGSLALTIADISFDVVCNHTNVEVHFSDLSALQNLRIYLRSEEGLSGWSHLLQKAAGLDLRIFVADQLMARAGPEAKPNFLGRSLGWEGLEIYPEAAFTAFAFS